MNSDTKSMAELEIEIDQKLNEIEQQENIGKKYVFVVILAVTASVMSLVSLMI